MPATWETLGKTMATTCLQLKSRLFPAAETSTTRY